MKLVIPHIHKTLGDAGFFARISEKGEIREIRVEVLEGLRQIEGIIVGRRIFEVPLVISRICGICPTSHILNACNSLEKALDIKVSLQTDRLRRLITSAQIIQSHSLHLFFMSLADFFNIEDEANLIKKFPEESKAALSLRDFALKIIGLVGGRTVHPITPRIGGFSKIPSKQELKKLLNNYQSAYNSALFLVELFKKIDYPQLKRETLFCSLFSDREYIHHRGEKIKIGRNIFSNGDFFSNEIEEDLKRPPSKRTEYRGRTYMLGAIARIKNNEKTLDSEAKFHLEDFKKKNNLKENHFFENTYYNSFCESIELIHFLNETGKDILALLNEEEAEPYEEYKIKKGSGLGTLEAPRGTLFSYFEIDKNGRIADCSIITPTAQFLRNLEEDLKVLLPSLDKLPKEKKLRRIKTLIRAYDPCIACVAH